MVRFVSVKSQSTPWIAISIWTCPIVQSEPRLKLKKNKDALECYNRIIQFHWQNHCDKKYRLDRKEGDFFYFARAILTIVIWFNQKGFKSKTKSITTPTLTNQVPFFVCKIKQNCWMKKNVLYLLTQTFKSLFDICISRNEMFGPTLDVSEVY